MPGPAAPRLIRCIGNGISPRENRRGGRGEDTVGGREGALVRTVHGSRAKDWSTDARPVRRLERIGRRHTEAAPWCPRPGSIHTMGAGMRRRGRRDTRAPSWATLPGRESCRRRGAEIARRNGSVGILTVSSSAVIGLERVSGSGVGHYKGRRTSSYVISAAKIGTYRADAGCRQRLCMAATYTPYAAGGRCTSSAWLANSVGSDLSLESSSGGCQRVNRDIFVDVYRLRMLAQVVQPRESSRAMTLERSLASVFPRRGVSLQMYLH